MITESQQKSLENLTYLYHQANAYWNAALKARKDKNFSFADHNFVELLGNIKPVVKSTLVIPTTLIKWACAFIPSLIFQPLQQRQESRGRSYLLHQQSEENDHALPNVGHYEELDSYFRRDSRGMASALDERERIRIVITH